MGWDETGIPIPSRLGADPCLQHLKESEKVQKCRDYTLGLYAGIILKHTLYCIAYTVHNPSIFVLCNTPEDAEK